MNKNIEHNNEIYDELESIENKIYAAPLGVVLDEKVKLKIDSFNRYIILV